MEKNVTNLYDASGCSKNLFKGTRLLAVVKTITKSSLRMPYRVSKSIVESRKRELDVIANAPNNVAAFKANDPERLAYLIREALHAARVLQIEPYASLNIRLSVQHPHLFVTAKTQLKATAVPVNITDVATEVGIVIVEDVTTPFSVIGSVMTNPLAPEVHFPGYDGELASIETWAAKRGYKLEQQEGVLILRRQHE